MPLSDTVPTGSRKRKYIVIQDDDEVENDPSTDKEEEEPTRQIPQPNNNTNANDEDDHEQLRLWITRWMDNNALFIDEEEQEGNEQNQPVFLQHNIPRPKPITQSSNENNQTTVSPSTDSTILRPRHSPNKQVVNEHTTKWQRYDHISAIVKHHRNESALHRQLAEQHDQLALRARLELAKLGNE